jgi:hypothetical protein
VQLREQQFEALMSGDDDSISFDVLIDIANDKKQAAKYEYIHHLEVHRCSVLRVSGAGQSAS